MSDTVNYVIWTKNVHIKITSTYLLRDEIFQKITKITGLHVHTASWMDIHRMRDRWINYREMDGR